MAIEVNEMKLGEVTMIRDSKNSDTYLVKWGAETAGKVRVAVSVPKANVDGRYINLQADIAIQIVEENGAMPTISIKEMIKNELGIS